MPFFHEVVESSQDLGAEPAAEVETSESVRTPDAPTFGEPQRMTAVALAETAVKRAVWGPLDLAESGPRPPFRTIFVAGALAALALSVIAAVFLLSLQVTGERPRCE